MCDKKRKVEEEDACTGGMGIRCLSAMAFTYLPELTLHSLGGFFLLHHLALAQWAMIVR